MPAADDRAVLPSRTPLVAPVKGILYPLDVLYSRAGVSGPTARPVPADRIPRPYRDLLVHENEMTSTLERHFCGPVTVRVQASFERGGSYFRRVLLVVGRSDRPVALAAARIRLDAFAPEIRAQILGEQAPLGRIWRAAGIEYRSVPTAFLDVSPSADMIVTFRMCEGQALYGRQTQVRLDRDHVGDIVEILGLA